MYVYSYYFDILYFTVKVTNEMVEKWIENQTSVMSTGFQQKGVLHIILFK